MKLCQKNRIIFHLLENRWMGENLLRWGMGKKSAAVAGGRLMKFRSSQPGFLSVSYPKTRVKRWAQSDQNIASEILYVRINVRVFWTKTIVFFSDGREFESLQPFPNPSFGSFNSHIYSHTVVYIVITVQVKKQLQPNNCFVPSH